MIQIKVHQKLLDLRKIEHLVKSPKFEAVFDMISECEKGALENMITTSSFESFSLAVDSLLNREIETYNIKQLRLTAKKLGVINCWSLSKPELLIRILDVRRSRGDVAASLSTFVASTKQEADTSNHCNGQG